MVENRDRRGFGLTNRAAASRRTFLRRATLLVAGLGAGSGLLSACIQSPAPAPAAKPTTSTGSGQAEAPKPAAPVAAPKPTEAAKPAEAKPAATAAPAAPKPAESKPAAEAKPGTAVTRGGTLRNIDRYATDSLDPHLATTRNNSAMALMFDTLLSYVPLDPKGEKWEIAPGLAESYKAVDPTTFEFTLRRGVKFHDGSDWNAAVARWNFERAANHQRSQVKQAVSAVKEIQTPDDYTLRIVTKAPAVAFPLQMTLSSNVFLGMLSKEAVEKLGDDAFGAAPVGTGPMKLKEWVRDNRIVVEKFLNHWEKGADGQPLPYLDGVNARLITDQSVSFLELRSGNVDTFPEMDLKDVATARTNPEIVVEKIPGAWQMFPAFYFNPRPDAPHPFSKDVKLRMAAQHAIDREGMAKALSFGLGDPSHSFYWVPGMLGYDESLPKYAYDLNKAKQLMAEAGYAGGIDVEVKVINRTLEVRAVEVLQGMWEQVGIRLKVAPMDRLPWIDDARAGNYQALSHAFSSRIDPQITTDTRTGALNNWSGYVNPEVDKLWDQAGSEMDTAKRAAIYKRINHTLHDQAYHVTGFRFPTVVGMTKKVQGMTTQWHFRYVSLGR